MSTRRYAVISPCRDEQDFLRRTLDSVLGQTEPPALWVMVDDGSTDATPQILSEYADANPMIRIVTMPPRTTRVLGPAVVHAFNRGLEEVDLDDFDYVVKLDVDLELPPRYFELLMDHMEADPRLASCSGTPCGRSDAGGLVPERGSAEISAGMTKFYRVRAFQDIGGLAPVLMWDGIDCHTARVRGWRVRSFDEPGLRFEHLRPMGSSDRGILRGKRRHGHGQYLMGTHPLYLIASVARRLTDSPAIIGALNILAGYVWAALRGVPRHGTREFRRQVRQFQLESLYRGKTRAVEAWEWRQQKEWDYKCAVGIGPAAIDRVARGQRVDRSLSHRARVKRARMRDTTDTPT